MCAWLSFSQSEGHKNFENPNSDRTVSNDANQSKKVANKTKINDKIKSKFTVPGQQEQSQKNMLYIRKNYVLQKVIIE